MAKAQSRTFWALCTVVLITLLLRPPLAVIGPLLNSIRADLGLSSAEVSILTSIPVLCFGVGAFAGPRLLKRFGLFGSFTAILVVVTIALATRPWFGFGYLLAATVALGVGIALSNVLFPTLILAEFPTSVPKMTAVYTTLLSVFAALAAGLAFPFASVLGGWRVELTWLAVPGVLAILTWRKTAKLTHGVPDTKVGTSVGRNLWNHPMAWTLAGFFGLQSANFYVLLNWMPSMLVSEGMSPVDAGGVLAFMSSIGVPVGLVLTANLNRLAARSTLLVAAISVVTALGMAMLALGPGWVWVASVFIGVGLSSSFPLSLALIGMKGGTQANTTSLSAIAQGLGYLIAASAVFLAGLLESYAGSWLPVILALVVSSMVQAFAGIFAANHKPLE